MNYYEIYHKLINQAKGLNRYKGTGVYYENHHIIPRCIGGTNDPENLVLLTAREHFIAHKLLTKMYPRNYKLLWAFSAMIKSTNKTRHLNSRQFQECKKALSEAAKHTNITDKGYHFNSNLNKITIEDKRAICDAYLGTTLEKEVLGRQYGINGYNVMTIMKEFGYSSKELRTLACKKREYRRNLRYLITGVKRPGVTKGCRRSEKAIELQRMAISKYWESVRNGDVLRVENGAVHYNPIICIETGERFISKHDANKQFFVCDDGLLIHRETKKELHWRPVSPC